MAQYQRFLSYLFEYEGDQKKENCGFAKIEIRGDVQRIFLSVLCAAWPYGCKKWKRTAPVHQ